jgi:hypothetical protein
MLATSCHFIRLNKAMAHNEEDEVEAIIYQALPRGALGHALRAGAHRAGGASAGRA